MRYLLLYLSVAVIGIFNTACTTTATRDGKEIQVDDFSADQFGQSDLNRLSTITMRENIESLLLLLDKLYRRNPAEWKKSGATSREEAIKRVEHAFTTHQYFEDIGHRHDIDILSLSVDPHYSRDRVALFIYGLYDMLLVAHGNKQEFYLLDSIDEGKVYNAARNVEIASWMLSTKKDEHGQYLLLSNHMGPEGNNLSFEREMSKIISRLDIESILLAERFQRAGVNYVQGLLFLNFLPVR